MKNPKIWIFRCTEFVSRCINSNFLFAVKYSTPECLLLKRERQRERERERERRYGAQTGKLDAVSISKKRVMNIWKMVVREAFEESDGEIV